MAVSDVLLLTSSEEGSADARLADLLRFLGVPCKLIGCADFSAAAASANGSASGVALAADTVRQLLQTAAGRRQEVIEFFRSHGSVFIYGLTPSSLSREDLQFISGGAVRDYSELPSSGQLTVCGDHRALCGPLSGLEVTHSTVRFGLKTAPGFDGKTFIRSAADSILLRQPSGRASMFLTTAAEVVDLNEQLVSNFDAGSIFDRLVPYVLFARAACPDMCWQPKRQHACLIIDDPLLRPRYGFLNVVELLRWLDQSKVAANLAFIPWNRNRSSRHVADMVRRSDRFALCVHGCDHTRGEFGGTDSAWLDTLAQLAVERMDQHYLKSGVGYQSVMVFPQGIFSPEAMGILKHRNFIAAVNTEVVPRHHSSEQGQVSLRSLLDMASMDYHDLALFSRRGCRNALADYALDLFMGKPAFFVAHHDYFRDGLDSLKALAANLHKLMPELTWATVGNVVDVSYLCRRASGDTTSVRMFGNAISLENDGKDPMIFDVRKQERNGSAVAGVFADGKPIDFDWNENNVRFSCAVPAGQSLKVLVRYRKPSNRPCSALGFGYRTRTAARRYLSEFRDGYVQPLKKLLSR